MKYRIEFERDEKIEHCFDCPFWTWGENFDYCSIKLALGLDEPSDDCPLKLVGGEK